MKWFEDNKDWAAMSLRLGLALVFIVKGYGKLTNIAGTTEQFATWGIPLAALAVWIVAIVEFFGGIALVAGFYTRYAAALIGIVALVAIFTVHLGTPFYGDQVANAMFERALLALAACISLLFSGPGHASIDSKQGRK